MHGNSVIILSYFVAEPAMLLIHCGLQKYGMPSFGGKREGFLECGGELDVSAVASAET